MNQALPRAVDLKEAMENAELEELDDAAQELVDAAVALINEERRPPAPQPRQDDPIDVLAADAMNVVRQNMNRHGRCAFSVDDARTVRLIKQLLRAMEGVQ